MNASLRMPAPTAGSGKTPANDDRFDVPVLLLVFRRPELTRRLVEIVAKLRPHTLLVAADGPRADHPEDRELCAKTRAAVDSVQWPGRVLRRYSDLNLGCGLAPSSAISWAFEHVDRAIILEDDCIPHPSFFPYCRELLQRHEHDERIMHIAGSTLQRAELDTPDSYVFSRFNVSWGWATWRRAWKHFDLSLQAWPRLKGTPWLSQMIEDDIALARWAADFDRAYDNHGNVSFWDFQWAFALWANNALAILPRTNLVSNAGCGPQGTHTRDANAPIAALPVGEMAFPLRHPPIVTRHDAIDRQFLERVIVPSTRPPRRPLTTRIHQFLTGRKRNGARN